MILSYLAHLTYNTHEPIEIQSDRVEVVTTKAETIDSTNTSELRNVDWSGVKSLKGYGSNDDTHMFTINAIHVALYSHSKCACWHEGIWSCCWSTPNKQIVAIPKFQLVPYILCT